jgi:hypothetical protein
MAFHSDRVPQTNATGQNPGDEQLMIGIKLIQTVGEIHTGEWGWRPKGLTSLIKTFSESSRR